MRKYRKQLNHDDWKNRLQEFVWGDSKPTFVGYCPFFWFTWFSLLVLPFALLLRLCLSIKKLKPKKKEPPYTPSDDWLLTIRDLMHQYYGCQWMQFLSPEVYHWVKRTPDWKDYVYAALRRKHKRDLRAEKSAKRKIFLTKLANKIEPVLKIMAPILALIGVSMLILGLTRYLLSLPEQDWIIFGVYVLYGLLGALILSLTVIGVSMLTVKSFRFVHDRGIIDTIFRKVSPPISFLVDTIDSLYTSECPIIEWGDETRPIERIYESN